MHITTAAFCTAGPAANLETQEKITVQDDSATESTAIGLFVTRDGDSFDAIDNRLTASTGTDTPNAASSEAQSSAQSASDDSSSKERVATVGKWLTVGGTVVLALVAVALAVMLLAPKFKSKKVLFFMCMKLCVVFPGASAILRWVNLALRLPNIPGPRIQ